MTLLTAHKILITSAVLMFVLYGTSELRNYAAGDAAALLRGVVSLATAGALGLYLRWVWINRPSDRQEP